MSSRDIDGRPLTPGINIDPVNIRTGLDKAAELGYGDSEAQMVVHYALQRWKRGEEAGGVMTWRSYYPRDFTSWLVIIAAAITAEQNPAQPP